MKKLTEREQGLVLLLICLVITAVVFTWDCTRLYNEGAFLDLRYTLLQRALGAIVVGGLGGALFSATLFVLVVMPLHFFINREKSRRDQVDNVDIDFLPKLFPICVAASYIQFMVYETCVPFSIMAIGY